MKQNKTVLWLLIPIVMLATVGAFAKIMTSYDHNEQMYISASIFYAQNKQLYKDFAYLQMPYFPLLYGSLFRLMNVTSYYYLLGKLISFIFLSLSSMTLFFLARRVVKDVSFCLSVVALFLLNMTIVNPASEASNYIIPISLSMTGFYVFFISYIENKVKSFGIALAGILLALSIGIKLTYATVIFPFIAIILLHQLICFHSRKTIREIILYALLPFLAGIAIGLLPTLLFLSDIQSFFFNNLGFHIANTEWRQITGYTGPMSLYSKIAFAGEVFFRVDNIILLLGILLGLGFSIHGSRRILRKNVELIPTGAFLAVMLVLVAIPTALSPTPSFAQYYAMPVSFCFLVLVFSYGSKSLEIVTLHRIILFILVLVSAAYNGPILHKHCINLSQRDKWTGLRFHDISMNVRSALINSGIGIDGKIGTLSPLFVTESNLNIYSELSTGPFLYRIGDLLTPEQRAHYTGTSPKTISDLFTADPPAAVLVGFEGELDKPLIEYAKANKYKKVDVPGLLRGELYVRP